jgi:hypothetical protein
LVVVGRGEFAKTIDELARRIESVLTGEVVEDRAAAGLTTGALRRRAPGDRTVRSRRVAAR